MRASVWLIGLLLLVGGYAALLAATQATMSGRLTPGQGPERSSSLVTGWSELAVGDRPLDETRGGARASTPGSPAVTFNQSAHQSARLRAGQDLDRVGLDALVPPLRLLPELPTGLLGPTADQSLLAGGLVWVIGISAAAAALRRRA